MTGHPLPPRVFRIRIIAAGDPSAVGREIRVEGPVVIGRDAAAGFVVAESTVSRRHARVESTADGLWITDLNSANGLYVGSARVSSAALQHGDRFALGGAVFECIEDRLAFAPLPGLEPPVPEEPEAAPSAPAAAPPLAAADEARSGAVEVSAEPGRPVADPGGTPADRRPALAQEGDAVDVSVRRTFLIDDPEAIYFVAAGGLLLFTVAMEPGGPAGPRTHFLDVLPGQCAFGFRSSRTMFGSGFLAVPKPGTQLRRIRRTRLRELARAHPDVVGPVVDHWVTSVAKAIAPAGRPGEAPPVPLEAGVRVALESGTRARSGQGVLWVEIPSGVTLVNDLTIPVFDADRGLFPLSPHCTLTAPGLDGGPLTLVPVSTEAALAHTGFWDGLDAFHLAVCECESLNKKLEDVDEFVRLGEKAERSDEAEEDAYSAIGAVMQSDTERGEAAAREPGTAEPILAACRLVGQSLGMQVRPHPAASDKLAYEEMVGSIATASGFRTRVVALRGEWWRADLGPLLGQRADTQAPVALLPNGPRAYTAVEPSTGTRQRVTGDVARQLSASAHCFYRPFPDGAITVRRLMVFGVRGLARDYRTLGMMGAVIGLFGTVTPYLTGQLFSTVIPQADRAMLAGFVVALILAAVASSVFSFVQSVATMRVQTRMSASIQAAVWDRLMNLPATFFRKYEAGDLADRAAGVDQIQQIVSGAGVAAVLGSFSGLFYVGQMFTYSLRLAVAAVVLTLVYVGTTTLANYLQLRYQRREMELHGRIQGLVLNLISGVAKLRVTGAENHAFRIWAQQFAEQRRISFRVGGIQNAAVTFTTAFSVLSSMVLFSAMLYDQTESAGSGRAGLGTGDFIAFSAAYGLFLAAMQSLGDASLNLLAVVPTYERLKPILAAPPEIDATKAFPGALTGAIELSHLHFRYDADRPPVIKDLSLRIKPGEFIAFVGASGCGKSTLMRLMLGFESPVSGTIYYDGQDLAALDLRMVRRQIGVVLQVSRVMPAEIYRNIIGTTSHTIDDAWWAAERAGLADDIRSWPMGMHTYVSEGGGTLSGGQRQRLMIARAIVNKPKILFLDEATSALDNRAQAIVTESLDKMDATRIVIAHRLSTVINADRICYVDGGGIAEMGTYQELMDKDGLFAELARRQIA
jgi:ATP-binding cassette subfamily C protein